MATIGTTPTPFYGPGDQFSKLSNQQANQSIGVGLEAARMSDPFAPERGAYQNQLRTLMSNPGEMTTSPYYQFALNQGLNSLQRKGTVRSGNKLAELVKFGEGIASQGYFQQANLLKDLSGATTGSPAAAGAAYSGAYGRSQDQRQQAASQKAYQGQQGYPSYGGDSEITNPVYASGYDSHGIYRGGPSTGGYSSGGYSGGYSGAPSGGGFGLGYDALPSGGYDDYSYGDSYSGYSPVDYGGGGYDDYSGYDSGGYADYGYEDYSGEY